LEVAGNAINRKICGAYLAQLKYGAVRTLEIQFFYGISLSYNIQYKYHKCFTGEPCQFVSAAVGFFAGVLAKKPSFGWLRYSFACFLNIPGRQG
jgi:hypothetical protein